MPVLNFTVIPGYLILNLDPFIMNTFCSENPGVLKIIFRETGAVLPK